MRSIWTRWAPALALVALLTACGSGGFVAEADIVVNGITDPIMACTSQPIEITGSGFLSESGDTVEVTFEALAGAPFPEGNGNSITITGRATSDTLIVIDSPAANTHAEATITVTLPGGASGSSAVGLAQITGGSLGPPEAEDDTYDAIGNVLLTVGVGQGVLQNDSPGECVPDEQMEEELPQKSHALSAMGPNGLEVIDYDVLSARGGTVQLNVDGSFTYDPPLGLEGKDSFTYEMTNGTDTDTATVWFLIRDMVWFISHGVPPGGTGRFTDPFSSLAEFNSVQGGPRDEDPGEDDIIFVYRVTSEPYDDGIRLLDGQALIGNGIPLVVQGLVIVPAGERPILTYDGMQQMLLLDGACVVLGNANEIHGLDIESPSGAGIAGTDVSGPTHVDEVEIRGAGSYGINLEGDCLGSFEFGAATSVVDAGQTGVRISGFSEFGEFGEFEKSVTPGVQPLFFDGTFLYEGTISQTDAGMAISVLSTTPGASITFENGTISYDGDTFSAIDLSEVHGTFTCTSPQTIEGSPFIGIYVENSSGTFAFEDTTIDVDDDAQSASGVELLEVQYASLHFTDLQITIAGDVESVAGGVGIRVGNLTGPTANLTWLPADMGANTTLVVDGTSTITMTDAEEACVIFGTVGAMIDLDMTFQSISVDGSPQTGGLFFNECLGSFAVTGTTTITNYSSAGILFLGGDLDLTFATLNISNGTGVSGRAVALIGNAGMFTASGGSVSNMTLSGVVAQNSNVTLSGVAFSGITVNVVELAGTCTVGGTGNTATTYGTLGQVGVGATITGTITFDVGTVP